MKAVGVRELKNRLSAYLREVRGGEEILVTDRGEVVATLRSPGTDVSGPYPELAAAARAGRARLGAPNDPQLYERQPRALRPGQAAELLAAERGER
jgi:antitoxin (DNA-binding transcriptional repressor) of toxin-antitoxin stability system